uniref:Uncharacterized protein n=1 Tax=Chromera velia CCMP2878 TaxID=1169474 RepID=A0A0G4EYS3_9ALVE|mmetsp:Transcript_33384/g.66193  ORF Transcript_33384/g.66193 Transcript_33384/m.66193 type:complete len:140 (+) Transcript_33384:212-631(+)|eukprot:Cvel_14255.t1-p1 / transcript=Cvel_14255.t1 / gene=Cvel_14255 / organism=Chromera_velia_CCMP2878 / gene_product=hypothetical protein / transcript_product=hypothetical protein / location=Cvel_scaffold1006:37566-39203(-) / protein_length=139 / sequence_SO=supercontig / SO=protein_coding / is_pseudo=false
MPRNVRYPASPVQEIFLAEPAPFVNYDKAKEAPTAPALPSPSEISDCKSLEMQVNSARREMAAQKIAVADYEGMQAKYVRCIGRFYPQLLESEDSSWKEMRGRLGAFSGVDFGTLKTKDPRIETLKYAAPPSVASKFSV